MARDPEAISRAINDLTEPTARGRLLARGLARGMVWKDGSVPEGGPDFTELLTSDLLDFGYGILALALELKDANRQENAARQFETGEAFRVAAEAIESAVRRGNPEHGDQGRHLVVGAAAFHLAGFAARSFSLLPSPALNKNLSSAERALGLLLRRDFLLLRDHIIQWLGDPVNSDDRISERLLNEEDSFGPEDAVLIAIGASFHRVLGLADTAFVLGSPAIFAEATARLETVVAATVEVGNVPLWWAATLTLHLLRDLWDHSLHMRLPVGPGDLLPDRWLELRRDFIAQLGTRKPPHIDLWPSQVAAAARAIDPSDDLVIALPTSAGKTRIAELCILRCLADNKRTIYVTPLRALSAQVERVLARTFVPLGASVTSLYGASGVTLADAQTLASADIVVATPEKLDFAVRQDPDVLNDVSLVVFDEGHMIGLGSREVRYEVLIQRLLRRGDAEGRRIVCLSAMFNPEDPYFQDFGNWLRADAPGEFVHVRWRPTRQRLATLDWKPNTGVATLSFTEGEKPFVPRFLELMGPQKSRKRSFPDSDIEFCICAANAFARDGHSVLVYSPLRSQVETLAREFRHMADQGYLTDIKKPPPESLSIALAIGREWLGVKHAAIRALEVGVGAHHAGLPRPFLNAVERLLDTRRLSVVIASPTLAQGIDLACSVLIFRSLQRYQNKQWVPISPAEFGNVVGRAGRAYVDLDGIAVLPTFEPGDQYAQHALFTKLAERSKGQRLRSGLALLVLEISEVLGNLLGSPKEGFLEYVLNNRELWTDGRLETKQVEDDDEDSRESLETYLADLDVAILSLIDPLECSIDDLASLLDQVLKNSLWQRTLAHEEEPFQLMQQELLRSRSEWLWRNTTDTQRRACFFSGLGQKPGLFLNGQLDALVDILVKFQTAIRINDVAVAAEAAVEFAERVMAEPFFSVRKVPTDWRSILASWVQAVAFADILNGRGAREAQKAQAFVQDGVVFRLVWAAEAVRVQAAAQNHLHAAEIEDGPAFALTYGVPSVPAALLCQIGFASRTGAAWAVTSLAATFTDNDGLYDWLRENNTQLSEANFWLTEDQYLLWQDVSAPSGGEQPRPWKRDTQSVSVQWKGQQPPLDSRVRVIGGFARSATICNEDLTRIGTAQLPFDPQGAALDGKVISEGKVEIEYFGR